MLTLVLCYLLTASIVGLAMWVMFSSIRQSWRNHNLKREEKGEGRRNFVEYATRNIVGWVVGLFVLWFVAYVLLWTGQGVYTHWQVVAVVALYVGKIAMYPLGALAAVLVLKRLVQFIAITWTDAVDQRRKERD